ncbi:MAG: hypothetical protein K6F52_06615 [Clostridia bacterium]|nr:hypothetical protein [Clostridia bacterium]
MRYLAELAEKNFVYEPDEKKYKKVPHDRERRRVNIINLGQLGGAVLFSLKLLGGEVIESIGIFDNDSRRARRYELEMNQSAFEENTGEVQQTEAVDENRIFDCDMILFCAKLAEDMDDIRKYEDRQTMFEYNREEIVRFAGAANDWGFEGTFGIVAESSDMLCAACMGAGISPERIRGFDLGVMASRAEYIIKTEEGLFEKIDPAKMRVFGYLGKDFIFANSLGEFDEELSKEMTRMLQKSAMKIKMTGAAPYICTAVASGTHSVIAFLKEEWHYSTVYLGKPGEKGGFFGIFNRPYESENLIEKEAVPDVLFHMLSAAFERHRALQEGRDPDAEEAARAAEAAEKERIAREKAEKEAEEKSEHAHSQKERAGDTASDYADRLKKQDSLKKKSPFALRKESLENSSEFGYNLATRMKMAEEEQEQLNAAPSEKEQETSSAAAAPETGSQAEAENLQGKEIQNEAPEEQKPLDPIALAKARAAERRKAAQEKADSLASSRFRDEDDVQEHKPIKVFMVTDDPDFAKDDKIMFDQEAFVEASIEEAAKKSAERTVSGTPIVGTGSGDAAAKRLMQARAARLAREEEELREKQKEK